MAVSVLFQLSLSLFSGRLMGSACLFVGVGEREEDAARSGRRSSCGAWGGNRGVALADGLDWDWGRPLEVSFLLGK